MIFLNRDILKKEIYFFLFSIKKNIKIWLASLITWRFKMYYNIIKLLSQFVFNFYIIY